MTASGEINELPSIRPGKAGDFALHFDVPAKGRCFLKLTYIALRETALVLSGHQLGFDEIALQNEEPRNQNGLSFRGKDKGKEPLFVKEDDLIILVCGQNFCYTYSKLTGLWNQCTIYGEDMLERPMELNLWRAPTDNDRNIRLEWERAHYDQTIARAYDTVWRKAEGKIVLRSTMSVAAVTVQRIVNIVAEWCISPGGSVAMVMSVKRTPEFPQLPRFGLRLFLPRKMNQVCYYGLGPVENYADKHQASFHGLFTACVDDMHEDYLRPQENGSRGDCDYPE